MAAATMAPSMTAPSRQESVNDRRFPRSSPSMVRYHYKEGIRLAEMGDWAKLMERLHEEPMIARHKDHHGMLPLHWACTEDDTPPELIRALLRAFPEGVLTRNNGQFLPLHIAIRAGASEQTLMLLCEARPSSLLEETPAGKTAVMLARESSLPPASLRLLEEAERIYRALIDELESVDLEMKRREVEIQTQAVRESMRVGRQTLHGRKGSSSSSIASEYMSTVKTAPSVASPTCGATTIDECSERESRMDIDHQQRAELMDTHGMVGACAVCYKKFSMFRKKYQCKSCFVFLCKKHVAGKISLPGFDRRRSACGDCYRTYRADTPHPNAAISERRRPILEKLSSDYDPRCDRSESTPTVLGRNSSFVTGPQTQQRFSASTSIMRSHSAGALRKASLSSSAASLTETSDRTSADITVLVHRVAVLEEQNRALVDRVAEQERQYNEAMLLLTETMTRVAELEMRVQGDDLKQSLRPTMTSENASDATHDFEFPTPFVEKFD